MYMYKHYAYHDTSSAVKSTHRHGSLTGAHTRRWVHSSQPPMDGHYLQDLHTCCQRYTTHTCHQLGKRFHLCTYTNEKEINISLALINTGIHNHIACVHMRVCMHVHTHTLIMTLACTIMLHLIILFWSYKPHYFVCVYLCVYLSSCSIYMCSEAL